MPKDTLQQLIEADTQATFILATTIIATQGEIQLSENWVPKDKKHIKQLKTHLAIQLGIGQYIIKYYNSHKAAI